jgi:hypothetical protein
MRPELAVAFVAGLFGLVPVMWQISVTRAQRRDRMTRLSHLRAELELLERLNTLQGLVSAGDEAAKREMNLTIKNALNKLLDQYNALSEIAPAKIAPSTVEGGRQPAPRQLSFLRRTLLLYAPNTALGWVLHTVFYVVGSIFLVFYPLNWIFSLLNPPYNPNLYALIGEAVFVTLFVIVLLSVQRLARRSTAVQLEKTAS